MKIINYLKKNYKNITQVIKKYPLTLFFSLLGGLLATICFNEIEKVEIIRKLVFISCFGIILFAKVEALPFRKNRIKLLSRLVSGILLGACYFYMPTSKNYNEIFVFLGLALTLFAYLFFVPNTQKINRENSVDHFIKSINALFVTGIYYHILFIGFLLLGISIEKLFDINFVRKWEIRLFILILFTYSPFNFLLMIEDKLSKVYSKFLKVCLRFVLLPLLISYGIVLYSYLIRLVIIREYPKEVIPFMVLAYSFLGIFYIYISDNLDGGIIYKKLKKYFYISLVPLTPLLYYSIIMRIRQYGITENRYFIFISALWLSVIIIYMIVSRKKHLLFLPYVTIFFIFFSTIGPVNSSRISLISQKNRLEDFMNNKKDTWSLEEKEKFSRFLDYFQEYHNLFESGLTKNKDLDKYGVAQEYGIEYVSKYSSYKNRTVNFKSNRVISIKDYDYFIDVTYYDKKSYDNDKFKVYFENNKKDNYEKALVINISGVEYRYFLEDIYREIYEKNKDIKTENSLFIEIDEKTFKAKVVLEDLTYNIDNDNFYSDIASIFIKLK